MIRARFLAGAAVLVAACALPTAANAQFSPCMVLGSPLPPPCIVLDAGKIAQQAAELRQKAQHLQQLASQVNEMKNIQGALGAVKGVVKLPYAGVTPIAPIQPITADAAIAEITRRLPTVSNTPEARAQFRTTLNTERRSTAGDGWAIAETTKSRLTNLDLRARTIQAVAICSARRPAGTTNDSMRTDWQINTRAKSLVMQTMATLKEVSAARLEAKSVNVFTIDEAAAAPNLERAPAPAPVRMPGSDWATRLGQVASLSNKLSALMTAKSIVTSFKDAISGNRQTQTEYGQVLQAAQSSESQLQRLLSNEARKKRISVQTLQQVANDYMSQDRTTWDDPSKTDIAKRLADAAEDRMDRLVSGDISNDVSDYLRNRAEAYKQEAFFRPIAEDAKAMAEDTQRSMQEYSQSLGLNIEDQRVLDAEIARTQAELGQVGNSMNTAPAEVLRQRDAIYTSTVNGSAQAQAEMQAVDVGDQQARNEQLQ